MYSARLTAPGARSFEWKGNFVALQTLKSIDGWLLLMTGLIWLAFAAEGGIVRGLLAGTVGAVGVGTGVAALLFPGDLRIPAFAGLGAVAGGIVALLGLFGFGFGSALGLGAVAALAAVAAGRLSLSWVPATPGVPARIEDVRLAAKVAADEALLASFQLRLDLPVGAALDDAARDVLALRDWLRDSNYDDPFTYHQTPPPLESVRIRERRTLGRDYEHVSFPSEWEPWAGEPGRERWLEGAANRTAHAYVVRSDASAPWLVAINGYRMGMPLPDLAVFDPRVYCQQLGLNLLIPVLPLHGPRRTGRLSGDGYLDGDVVRFIHAEAQAMWDIRRLIGWVRSQGGDQIGTMGISLGGYNCALLAALEDDLACAIAGVPVADFSRILWAHAPAGFLSGLIDRGVDRGVLDEVLRPVSPLAKPPRLSGDALAIFGGVGDRVVPPEHQRDLIEHWKPAAYCWYQGGHLSFRLESAVDGMVRSTLREHLSSTAAPGIAAS